MGRIQLDTAQMNLDAIKIFRLLVSSSDEPATLDRIAQEIAGATGWSHSASLGFNTCTESSMSTGSILSEQLAFSSISDAGLQEYLLSLCQEKQIRWIEDLHTEATAALRLTPEYNSLLLVPILHEDELTAVLAFLSVEVKKRDDALLTAIESIACGVAEFQQRVRRDVNALDTKYRSVLENLNDGYFETDKKGKYLAFNPAMCRLHQCSPEDMANFDFRQHADEKNLQAIYQTYASVFQSGKPAVLNEWEFIRTDGTTSIIETSVHRRTNAHGEPIGFWGISRDVTERRIAEHALRSSEERFRGILESIEDAYYEVDLAGTLTYFNTALCRMLGFTPEELQGRNNRENMSTEMAAEVYAIFKSVFNTGRPVTGFDWRLIHKSGEIIVGEGSAHLVRDASQNPIGFRGILRDVTHRRHTEDALRDSEARFRALTNLSSDMYWEQNAQHLIVRLEGRAITERALIANQEALGKRIDQLGFSVEGGWPAFTDMLDNRLPFKNVLMYRAEPDQASRYISISGEPVFHKNGDFVGYRSVARDISKYKNAEIELLRRHQELASLNERLTQAQAQLVQSEKMASLGQLAAGVAHEINNPIGYVASNIGSLLRNMNDVLEILEAYEEAEPRIADASTKDRIKALREKLDLQFLKSDITDIIEETQEGIARVRKIVQDLKDFSRAEHGQLMQYADLHAGIDSTLNIVHSVVKYKAKVIKQYGDLPPVQCLPSQINQVILNLVINAAQALPDEYGTITIRTQRHDSNVWIDVIDTGIGISKENMARVFDPFFTTKPVGTGTGLGLSLSYGIIQRHNGKIEIDSTPGVGSRFRIVMPIMQPAAVTI